MHITKRVPKSLYAMKPNEILGALALEKPFQGRQIYQWLAKGVTDFHQMTNLSKELRERLALLLPSPLSSKVIAKEEDESGAIKLGIELHDSLVIECILLTDKEGRSTACLSSQIGCAMGCTFCRTATMGLRRNLKDFEIVEQFVHLRELDPSISHIVFMGMGEPMVNFNEVQQAITFFHDPQGFNIGLRRVTISTCGVVPGILQLADSGLPIKLAVSLVTADNTLRSQLMPINNSYPLEHLKEALLYYQKKIQKRFTLEYVMLKGKNTDTLSAQKLAQFIRGLDVVVNLIPWNPADELEWETPSTKEITRFTQELTQLGVPYTRRYSRGREVNGACGQLAVPMNR